MFVCDTLYRKSACRCDTSKSVSNVLPFVGASGVRAHLVPGVPGEKLLPEEPPDERDKDGDPVPLPGMARSGPPRRRHPGHEGAARLPAVS